MWSVRATDDRRRTHAYHITRTYLQRLLLLASSHRHAHCRYGERPFLISPDPLLPTLSFLPTSNVPPPPGRGMRQFSSVRTMRATTQSACFQSPCPLTHCVRSLSARCLLATRRATRRKTGRETERVNRTPACTRKAGRSPFPVSMPACSAWFCVHAPAIVRCSRICRSRNQRGTVPY